MQGHVGVPTSTHDLHRPARFLRPPDADVGGAPEDETETSAEVTRRLDVAEDLVALGGVMQRAERRCVDGRWETREEWSDTLVAAHRALTTWHQVGSLLGLEHEPTGSIGAPRFPSTVMAHGAVPDRISWSTENGAPGWGPYDRGALARLYAYGGERRRGARDGAPGAFAPRPR